jgi:hypothetical protein
MECPLHGTNLQPDCAACRAVIMELAREADERLGIIDQIRLRSEWQKYHDVDMIRGDGLLNLHGSPNLDPPRKRRRFKKTLIPNGGMYVDDDEERRVCDIEIRDEITDTTIEDVLNGSRH